MKLGNKHAMKYNEPVNCNYPIRFTKSQKELIDSVCTADYWRDFMLDHAKKVLRERGELKDS